MIEKFGKVFDYSTIDRDVTWRAETAASRATDSKRMAQKTVAIACPACSKNDAAPVNSIYDFHYVRCASCDLVYLRETPQIEELKSIYVEESEEIEKSPGDDLMNTDAFDNRVEMICTPKVEFVLEHVTKHAPSWTDIGCGVGDMVQAASGRGCNAIGYDIDQREIEHGQAHGSNVECLDVTQANAKKVLADSDIVSLISVIEHVPNCAEVVQTVVSNAPRDASFVFEVPRFNSLSTLVNMNFPNSISRHMLPPNHVMLFTDLAFDNLLKSVGLKRRATWYYGADINEMIGNMLLNSAASNIDISALKDVLNDLQFIVDRAKFCDEMLVVCERV